jgi:hypothetical protein
MTLIRPRLLAPLVSLVVCMAAYSGPGSPVVVRFDAPQIEGAMTGTFLDPTVRIKIQHLGAMRFGLVVDQTMNLCSGAGAIRAAFRIDEQILMPKSPPAGPLPLGPRGKRRSGGQSTWVYNDLHITEILEVIPSQAKPGEPRTLDTVLIRYVIENKTAAAHKVGVRIRVDTMCGNNDGALFAAPTTHPGQILDGIALRDGALPPFVQILQNADLKNPGFVGHFTLKMANVVGPDRFVCTSHGAPENGWDVPAQPANGDSDCALFWEPRTIAPGGKLEVGYAYGKGLASADEGEGRLSVALTGSFEPEKLFTIMAYVDEPRANQTLALELASGLELIEGKAIQPLAPPGPQSEMSLVLWKGRVRRLGAHSITIRSSTGVAQTNRFTVTRAAEAGRE